MKDIAVILVNYNSSDYTLQCIGSILTNTPENIDFSVVVVDNHSGRKEVKKLDALKDLAHVQLVRMTFNSGFSAANEAGMKEVDAKYYYFLNNDTVLKNDVLSILFNFMEKNPGAGIASGQMYQNDGSLGINFNYFPDLRLKFLGSGLLRIIHPEEFPKKGIEYGSPLKVPLLNGSSLFVRKKALDVTGGFDTRFFLYCEEEDLALRMKKKGFACYLVPEARYVHYGGKSSIQDSGINYLMLREFYISQHYLYRKHYGRAATIIWRISQFFRIFRKFYIHPGYARLGLFVLFHPYERYSLRHSPDNRGEAQGS